MYDMMNPENMEGNIEIKKTLYIKKTENGGNMEHENMMNDYGATIPNQQTPPVFADKNQLPYEVVDHSKKRNIEVVQPMPKESNSL